MADLGECPDLLIVQYCADMFNVSIENVGVSMVLILRINTSSRETSPARNALCGAQSAPSPLLQRGSKAQEAGCPCDY